MRSNGYKKRLVRWHHPEDGWVYAKNGEYSIAPSMKFEGQFELWSTDKLISKGASIHLLKGDADNFELNRSKHYG